MGEMTCGFCGESIDFDANESGFVSMSGDKIALCILHHEAFKAIAVDGDVNWFAMDRAQFRMADERPSLTKEPEKWETWDPVARLVHHYRIIAAEPAAQKKHEQWKRAQMRKKQRG